MAASFSPALASSSSSSTFNTRHSSFSVCLISNPHHTPFHFSKCYPQVGICKFSTWNGLRRHLGLPTSRCIVKIERKRRCKGVCASLFGVGAPEALVIGVVALLVFGPKGLAEVARNIGKTLRAFQPTIRELQEVSRDFKSTLEREIGLDEIEDTDNPTTNTTPTTSSEDSLKADTPTDATAAESKAYTTEEYLKAFAEQQKKQREKETRESQAENQDNRFSTSEASLSGENVNASEGQVEASGDHQQKEAESTEILLEPKSQPEDSSSSSSEASLNGNDVKMSKQELEASESQVEPQSQSQVAEGTWTSKEAETQEYLRKLEEEVQAILAEKQKRNPIVATEAKPEDTQEAASVIPPHQKSEGQT